jgi:Fe-S-cluster formation regulator IscX/YfhJ
MHECLEGEEEEVRRRSGNSDLHRRIQSLKNYDDDTKMLTGLNKLCVGYSVC